MDIRTNTVSGHGAFDVSFDGRTVDFAVSEAYTAEDGRVFVSGVMTDQSTLNESTFVIEVNDPDFANFADKGWKDQAALMDAKIEGILEASAANGRAAFTFLDSDDPSKIIQSIQQNMAPPAVAEVVEPEGPKPANLEAGEPIRIADHQPDGPSLFEGFNIGDQTGDLVVHDIEFVDNKPFLTGTFSVETPTGSEVREFAVAINVDNFPNVEDLSVDDVRKLTSPELVQQMLDLKGHDIVLSVDEAFSDRARLLSDIDAIRTTPNLAGFQGDIPHLANLAQEYPDLVNTMDLYAPGWAPFGRDDNVLKLAVMDHVGITDPELRANLVETTGDFADFHESLRAKSSFFEASPATRRVVSEMAENARHLADVASTHVRTPDAHRVGGGLKGVAFGAAAALAISAGVANAAPSSPQELAVFSSSALMAAEQGDYDSAAQFLLEMPEEQFLALFQLDMGMEGSDNISQWLLSRHTDASPEQMEFLAKAIAAYAVEDIDSAANFLDGAGFDGNIFKATVEGNVLAQAGYTGAKVVEDAALTIQAVVTEGPYNALIGAPLEYGLNFFENDLQRLFSPKVVALEEAIPAIKDLANSLMEYDIPSDAPEEFLDAYDRFTQLAEMLVEINELQQEADAISNKGVSEWTQEDGRNFGDAVRTRHDLTKDAARLYDDIYDKGDIFYMHSFLSAMEHSAPEMTATEVDLSEMGDFSIEGVAVGGDLEQLRSAALAGLDIDAGHLHIEDPAVSNAPVVAPTLS